VKEENLPVGAVVTEECNLVVRRNPRATEQQSIANTQVQQLTTWKGQQVKNFKRFQKVCAQLQN